MSRLGIAAKATVVSQIFRFASLGLSFITVPLFLKWLGQERYGLLLTAGSLTSLLMLTNGGLNWASMLLIAQAFGRGDRTAVQSIVRNSFSLNIVLCLPVVGLVIAAVALRRGGLVLPLVPEHPEMNGILMAIGATVIYRFLISPVSSVFVGLQQVPTDSIIQGIGSLLGMVAGLVMAAVGGNIAQILFVQLGGSILLGAVAFVACVVRNPWAFKAGPLWEKEQIRQQFRSAMKSLTMQAGFVLWSSAPVIVLSKVIGPKAVPLFTVPTTLLGVPFGLIAGFNGSLQAAYGEALGKGDLDWIRTTLHMLMRRTITLLVIVAAGFMLLAGSFVSLWTAGALDVPNGYLVSTLVCFLVSTPLIVFRGALSGMNRHRVAALGDLLSGTLAFVLTWIVVSFSKPSWVGLAPALAALPLWWIFPMQFASATSVQKHGVLDKAFLTRLAVLSVGTVSIGLATKAVCLRGHMTWFCLVATGLSIAAAFCSLGMLLFAEDFRFLSGPLHRLKGLMRRSP